MICELCGQEMPFLKPLLIEGSLLKVCSTCAKFGQETTSSTSETGSDTGASGGGGSTSQRRSARSAGGGGYAPDTLSKEEIIRRRLEFRERRMTTKDVYEQRGDLELVDDYHKRIQQARDKLGLNQEQLGQKINERKSVISKIESRSMKPDDKLVRKLEKALGISLMETIE